MARKFPVFATYKNVVRFVLTRFGTTLRLTWLPVVAALTVTAASIPVMMALVAPFTPEGPQRDALGTPVEAPLWVLIAFTAAFALMQIAASAAAAVSTHRAILFGDTRPREWFNFPLGAAEVRFIVMGLLCVATIIGVVAIIVGLAFYVFAEGDVTRALGDIARRSEGPSPPPPSGKNFLLLSAYIGAWLVVAYLMMRLALWPASVVATGRLSPAEPWRLMRGNMLRLIALLAFATLYAAFIPLAMGFTVVMSMRFREVIGDPRMGPVTMTPENVWELMWPALPFLTAFYFGLIILTLAVTAALISYTYKALKGVDADTPIHE